MHKTQKEFFFLIVLVLLFISELFFDSIFFSNYKSFGYELTSFLVISFTIYLYFIASARLKQFLILMIPLSWLGEVICSDVLGLYNYRMEWMDKGVKCDLYSKQYSGIFNLICFLLCFFMLHF